MFLFALLTLFTAPAPAPAHAETTAQDVTFVHDSAQGDLFEIQLARLALQRATSQTSRQFADRMIQDHSKSYAELAALTRGRGIALPRDTSDTLKGVIRYFQLSRSTDWDYDYVTYEVADHIGDISAAQKELQQGRDAAIRTNAQQDLPVLETHLALARAASRELAQRGR